MAQLFISPQKPSAQTKQQKRGRFGNRRKQNRMLLTLWVDPVSANLPQVIYIATAFNGPAGTRVNEVIKIGDYAAAV